MSPPPDENPSHENGASVTDDIKYTMSAGDFYAGDMYDGFSDVLREYWRLPMCILAEIS